jgi:hypothetical protein
MEPYQQAISHAPPGGITFLRGPAGTGKTYTAVERLRYLLHEVMVPPAQILLMLPQRTLSAPYDAVLSDPAVNGVIDGLTVGGIARRAVDLFWPLVAESFGFAQPDRRPTFLTLETAQYFMARVVGPEIDRNGYFDTITIERSRLYSQIIDNLNKAAVIPGFQYTDIADRLKSAWVGESDQLRMYDDVQTCASLFRAYCLQHNLLDFSLQIELFTDALWPLEPVKAWVFGQAQYVIADNLEEDTPVAHNILREILQQAQDGLLVFDEDAGYRRFLGADDDHALATLTPLCDRVERFTQTFVTTPPLIHFAEEIALSLGLPLASRTDADPATAFAYEDYRYHPQMLDGVTERVTDLIEGQGVPPQEIVIIAPYMSDALRFSLMNRLEARQVPVRSHRPSRSLRQEPSAQAMLNLAAIAHPDWGLLPAPFDIAYTLMESIAEIDLVRAQLLARYAYHQDEQRPHLRPFDQLNPTVKDRVTFAFGQRYDRLQQWLESYRAGEPLSLDHFLSKLFGEVLSQPGLGFHQQAEDPDRDPATVAANLIESAAKFRWMLESSGTDDGSSAQEYVEMVGRGVIADQYLASWRTQADDAVLVASAYTYLLSNRPVGYQFWLNVGGTGWSERLYQPLTNPYVLRLDWPTGQTWTDADEIQATRETLYRLVSGLVRRCRAQIFLGFSELGEQGYQQRGQLLQAIQAMLRRQQQSDRA